MDRSGYIARESEDPLMDQLSPVPPRGGGRFQSWQWPVPPSVASLSFTTHWSQYLDRCPLGVYPLRTALSDTQPVHLGLTGKISDTR